MKIKRLHLRNFQSHPDTEVELSPGINAFVGASDQGKTATIRGLNWLANNSPSGDGLVSDWARGKDVCSVTAELDTGRVVSRVRSPKRNGYDLDGQELSAVRTNVPEEVKQALALEAVNWQRQLDAPFLLSESPGQRARFFNQLIRLDEAEKYFSAAESLRRQVAGLVPTHEATVKSTAERLSTFQWVDGVAQEMVVLRASMEELTSEQARFESLRQILMQLEIEQEKLDAMANIAEFELALANLRGQAQTLVGEASKLNKLSAIVDPLKGSLLELERLAPVEALLTRVTTLVAEYHECEKVSARVAALKVLVAGMKAAEVTLALPGTGALEEALGKYRELWSTSEAVKQRVSALSKLSDEIRIAETMVKNADAEITSLLDQLPELCPVCGGSGKIKEHTHG